MIVTTQDFEADLTVHECRGPITSQEIAERLQQIYAGRPTRNVIWDVTGVDTTLVTPADLRDLSMFSKRIAHSRAGGRTAIVGAANVAYGLARMYEAFSTLDDHEAPIMVFRTREEAEAWVREES